MAKTDFANGTVVSSTFLDTIYQTGGGHRHDGGTEDGHVNKIDLAADVTGLLPRANQVAPRGYLDGGILTYVQDTDAWNLQIGAVHACLSSDALMATSGAATKYVVNAAGTGYVTWAAGNNAGGVAASVATGGPSDGQWLHVFLTRNPGTEAVDYLLDTSITAANAPSGWTQYRRIGSVQIIDVGSSKFGIRKFKQAGDRFLWENAIADWNATFGDSFAVANVDLTVPTGLSVAALVVLTGSNSSTGLYLQMWDGVIGATRNADTGIYVIGPTATFLSGNAELVTTDSQRVYGASAHTSDVATVLTRGWIDSRGKQ